MVARVFKRTVAQQEGFSIVGYEFADWFWAEKLSEE